MKALAPAAFSGVALLAVTAFAQTAKPEGHAQRVTDEQVARAGRLFEGRCATCHQPPDLRFDVDRAWLNQVLDTA